MKLDELIAAIRALRDYGGVDLRDIEKTLTMPRNCLSGMLNGTRPFPPKWQKLLTNFVLAKRKGNKEIIIPIGMPKSRPADQPKTTKKKPSTPFPTKKKVEAKKVSDPTEKSTKTPPAGLDKAQLIRWHRERNQKLQ